MSTDVESLLNEKSISFNRKGKDYLIKCLNPEHDDAHPSLRIDAEGGQFHCLGCGFKGNIFTYFNRYRNVFNSKVNKVKKHIRELRKASWSGFSIPPDAFFIDQKFGNISVETVKKFQAFKTTSMGMENRIVFPIYDAQQRIVGFQGRYLNTSAPPKYLAYPPQQSLPWYPNAARCNLEERFIVLVEGLRDALYLHDNGITSAVCIFGTKSVSKENIVDHLTPFMLSGVDKVFIMFDGDDAGRSAAEHVETCIKHKTNIIVEVINLPDGLDPATMGPDLIKELKNMLQNS